MRSSLGLGGDHRKQSLLSLWSATQMMIVIMRAAKNLSMEKLRSAPCLQTAAAGWPTVWAGTMTSTAFPVVDHYGESWYSLYATAMRGMRIGSRCISARTKRSRRSVLTLAYVRSYQRL